MTFPWLSTVDREFVDRFESGRLAHALLLSGPAGTGKQELAQSWVASLLCLGNAIPACGECRSCQLFRSGAHPDYRSISYELNDRNSKYRTELVIDQIRALISSLQLTTTISERKVALIFPADAMNRNASNALLKTLEEPPGDSILLLVSDDPGKLPATIRSRCQGLHVRLPERSTAVDWIQTQGSYGRQDAEESLMASAGSPLRAIKILQDGGLEHYRELKNTLRCVRRDTVVSALGNLNEIDPHRLWIWLSILAAEKVKSEPCHSVNAAALSELQQLADRNRSLLPSPVRKDFLLQDWLIQWADLNV